MLKYFVMAMWLPLLALGAGLLVLYSRQTRRTENVEDVIFQPVAKVSIIIPAYNEENFIENTLLSLKSQNVVIKYPEMFEFIVVDNESTDDTINVAARHAHVVSASRGKLNALTAGVNEATGEILVFIDADVIADANMLNLLLQNFCDNNLVAASGSTMHDYTPLDVVGCTVWNALNSAAVLKMNGGCLAVRKSAFREIGGFNLEIDQFDRSAMQQEEEFGLASRLKRFGKTVIDLEATFWVPPRMQYCATCNSSEAYQTYCAEVQAGERF